jgi:cell division septal protein FtsQ
MPVPAPADKRFRRAHVSPTRRRTWRRSWPKLAAIVVACAGVSYLGLRIARIAMSAQALAITRISVEGNGRISTDEVLALLDGLEGSNVLTADLDEWRGKLLLGSRWVAQATLRRVFPNGVAVVLSERRAVGIGQIDDTPYLIDRSGFIIDEFGPDYADLDLPIVDGLATGRDGTLLVDEDRADLAGRLLGAVQDHPDLAARISQIDVTDARDAVVVLKDDATRVRLGDSQFVERLQSYIELAPRLREQVPEIEFVDLRFVDRVDDDQVIVGPPRKAGSPRQALRRGRG